MATVLVPARDDLLSAWVRETTSAPRLRGMPASGCRTGIRFAFYGRLSTVEYQDAASSQRWQRDNAVDLIDGRGTIEAEFFDVGCSRSVPWMLRPEARRLLDALAGPCRGFDAIVVGEYERAFAGGQLRDLLPVLERLGVQLWLPETGGPVEVADPAHQALLMLLGYQSRREVLRSRFRTAAAMRVQARDQGRHLGGRPPYGYRLVDAGPHPNQAHARWGRRLHRLDPDPITAPHVRWIFAQRLAGESAAGIACALNHLSVPPPSAHDPGRNPHRSGQAWTLRTVAEILANPRYTGRQVWNRQRVDHNETEPGDKRTSRGAVRRWNPRDQWVISTRVVHPPLVSEADFVQVQTVSAVPTPQNGQQRRYQLTGLVFCCLCGRRAEAHWVHGRPGYRCRHGRTSASPPLPGRPKPLYLREEVIIAAVLGQIDYADGEHDPEAAAGFLRTNGLTVTCDRATIRVTGESTTGVPQQRPPPAPSET
jgi:site-specific DNA recombinase